LLSDGSVLVVGGDGMDDPVRYDPTTASWEPAGQSSLPRSGALLFALPGDRAVALEGDSPYAEFFGAPGGARVAPRCDVSSETYSAASASWTAAPSEPESGQVCPSGALLTDGQVLIGSESRRDPTSGAYSTASPYVLDAQQRCWSTTGPPVVQRYQDVIVALADGRALTFGGDSPNSATTSAETYTPGNPSCPAPVVPDSSSNTPTRLRFAGVTLGSKHLDLTATGRLLFVERCPASAAGHCSGKARVRLLYHIARGRSRGTQRRLTIGRAAFVIRSGTAARLVVRVGKRNRVRIAAESHPTVIITTTARDDAGRVATLVSTRALRVLR
jgi:hypothetical protein